MHRVTLQQKENTYWPSRGAVLALALFFSGPFSIFTPLPFLYYWVLGRSTRDIVFKMGLPTLAAVSLVYYLIHRTNLNNGAESTPLFWMVSIPARNYIQVMGSSWVSLMGVGYFVFYFLLAHFLWKSFLSFHRLNKILFPLLSITTAISLVYVSVASSTSGFDLIEILKSNFVNGVEQFLAAPTSQERFSAEQLAVFKSFSSAFVEISVWLTPSFFVLGLLMIVLCNLLVAMRFFNPLLMQLGQMILNRWALSFHYVWGLIALALTFWTNYYWINFTPLHFLVLNGLLILSFLYFLQGLAIVGYYFENKKWPFFLKISFYFFIFFMFQVGAPLLFVLGFVDAWLDLRKLNTPTQSPPVRMGSVA